MYIIQGWLSSQTYLHTIFVAGWLCGSNHLYRKHIRKGLLWLYSLLQAHLDSLVKYWTGGHFSDRQNQIGSYCSNTPSPTTEHITDVHKKDQNECFRQEVSEAYKVSVANIVLVLPLWLHLEVLLLTGHSNAKKGNSNCLHKGRTWLNKGVNYLIQNSFSTQHSLFTNSLVNSVRLVSKNNLSDYLRFICGLCGEDNLYPNPPVPATLFSKRQRRIILLHASTH